MSGDPHCTPRSGRGAALVRGEHRPCWRGAGDGAATLTLAGELESFLHTSVSRNVIY